MVAVPEKVKYCKVYKIYYRAKWECESLPLSAIRSDGGGAKDCEVLGHWKVSFWSLVKIAKLCQNQKNCLKFCQNWEIKCPRL